MRYQYKLWLWILAPFAISILTCAVWYYVVSNMLTNSNLELSFKNLRNSVFFHFQNNQILPDAKKEFPGIAVPPDETYPPKEMFKVHPKNEPKEVEFIST